MQVNEWEEEICQLNLKLENLQKDQKDEILNLESICNDKVMTLETEIRDLHKKNVELELKQKPSNSCGNFLKTGDTSPNGRQTDAEKMWQKTKMRDPNTRVLSNSGLSTFTPHLPSSSRQGPSSLPVELVHNAQKDVRRLQELRRYIQEECDHLLLKKERLKEEVGQHSVNPWHAEQSCMSLDTYLRFGDGVHRDVQSSHSLHDVLTHVSAHHIDTPDIKEEDSLHLSSMEQAYKVADTYIVKRSLKGI